MDRNDYQYNLGAGDRMALFERWFNVALLGHGKDSRTHLYLWFNILALCSWQCPSKHAMLRDRNNDEQTNTSCVPISFPGQNIGSIKLSL
ncbi:MAG TPA: hypothetical protein VHD56_04655 [Tepidisphaeraceae bacterium]|nr:hypothetical protein [Tepidisphaeraceae bacterium]